MKFILQSVKRQSKKAPKTKYVLPVLSMARNRERRLGEGKKTQRAEEEKGLTHMSQSHFYEPYI